MKMNRLIFKNQKLSNNRSMMIKNKKTITKLNSFIFKLFYILTITFYLKYKIQVKPREI